MLNREFANRQVRRLAGLRYYPDVIEAMTELIEALMTAPTEYEEHHSGPRWLRATAVAPTPADVYAAFPEPEEGPGEYNVAKEPACQICSDTGWRIARRTGVSGGSPR